jgi:predicted TIM-barrel fold metal-dependent hydrolase
MNIEILDTHFHVWDPAIIRYPWVETAQVNPQWFLGPRILPPEYSLDDYRNEWSRFGVRPFAHVEAGAAPGSAVSETEFIVQMVDGREDLRIVVGADLEQRDIAAELERQCEHPGVVGVRQIVTWHPDRRRSFVSEDLLASPRWREGFRLLEVLGLGFDLQIYPSQARAAAHLASLYPSVRFVLNHAVMPTLGSCEQLALWRTSLSVLADHENLAIKVGGFSMTNANLQAIQVENAVNDVLDAFGSRRVMIGTNAPVESTRNSPTLFMAGLWAALRPLSQTETHAIAQGNAHDWYSLRK